VTGRFISLEGGEGAGKSSALDTCRRHLEAHGFDVVLTREPGGSPLAERIRNLMLDPAHADMHAPTELLLAFAARAQHVRDTIRPALARGAWVLSDRFTDSSYAYQGGGRGLPMTTIAMLEDFAVDDTRPGLTLLLDLPVAQGLDRMKGRGGIDRIEAESTEFFERVRATFRKRATADAARVRVIDASQSIENVAADLRAALDAFIAGPEGAST
jgi:dTMP kinase